MPRLFTGLEIPAAVADTLSRSRGGLFGARWIDPASYHVTLRFIGDVDHGIAREVAALLGEARLRAPVALTVEGLSSFGGDRPRALIARVAPTPELTRLQAEHERLMRRVGLDPETRKYTPHVTLARLKGVTPAAVAGFIASCGPFPPQRFTAERFVLFSARDSVGGGPYLTEAVYAFDKPRPRDGAGASAAAYG